MKIQTLVASLLLFVSSCITVEGFEEPTEPIESVAIINGYRASFGASVNPYGISRFFKIILMSVDGEPTKRSSWSGHPDDVRVLPGIHKIGVFATAPAVGKHMSGESELSYIFEAGKTYWLTATFRHGELRKVGVVQGDEEPDMLSRFGFM